jgi:FkbM family methyltransferase
MRSPGITEALDTLTSIRRSQVASPSKVVTDEVVLYGAGMLGELALHHLRRLRIHVTGFMDRFPGKRPEVSGIPLYGIDHPAIGTRKLILVSTVSAPFSVVSEDLKVRGWERVMPFYDFLQGVSAQPILNNGWFSGSLSEEDMRGCETVLRALEEPHSRAAYLQMIAWRVLRRDDIYTDAPVEALNRYFIQPVLERLTGNESYLDVGAYDGRVLHQLLEHTGQRLGSAVLVEPEPANLTLLRERIGLLPEGLQARIRIVDSALAEFPQKARFAHGFGMASKLSQQGQGTVRVMTVDEAGISPTFVKIHTEGSELAVLRGAAGTFGRCRPVIAVTVYHARDGLWEIQNHLIQALRGYRFYFRLHAWCANGAVFYAVPTLVPGPGSGDRSVDEREGFDS